MNHGLRQAEATPSGTLPGLKQHSSHTSQACTSMWISRRCGGRVPLQSMPRPCTAPPSSPGWRAGAFIPCSSWICLWSSCDQVCISQHTSPTLVLSVVRRNKYYTQAKLLLRRGYNAYKQNELNAEKIKTLSDHLNYEAVVQVIAHPPGQQYNDFVHELRACVKFNQTLMVFWKDGELPDLGPK